MTLAISDTGSDLEPEPEPWPGAGSGSAGPWATFFGATRARLVIVVSSVIWVAVLPMLAHASVSRYGLLFAGGGAGIVLAAAGMSVAFVLALRSRVYSDAIAALVGFIAVTRATASIITGLPLFTWTFKHIGVVDNLAGTGHLARAVDIYNDWPGLFSATAWFSSLTGLSPVTLARWFPVAADLAIVLGMYCLSRAFGQTRAVALVAAFGIQALDWVGQDYFSPQAVAFIMALTLLALILRSRESTAAALLSLPIFVAITVTHQLTPFWLCGVALLLGLTRQIRPRWLGVAYTAIAIGYVLLNYSALSSYGLLSGFDPLANAQSNVPTAGNAGRELTSMAAKIPALALWGTAAIVAVRGRIRRRPVWVPVVIAFTSFALLGGQSYGGEAIFRVYLYSLPGCLLLITPGLTAILTRRRSAVPACGRMAATSSRAALVLTAIVVAASLQAYYGTWFTNVVAADGLAAERNLLATAPTNSLLLPLTTGIAERPSGDYALFAAKNRNYDAAIISLPGVQGEQFTTTDVARLTDRLASTRVPVYVIITEQMRRYSDYYGLFPAGSIARLTTALESSPRWRTLQNTPTLSIFQLST